MSCDDALEDLTSHSIIVLNFELNLFFLKISLLVKFLEEDLAHILALVKEGLERALKVFLPQECNVGVLIEEFCGVLFDLVEVVGDTLNLAEKLELVLDFDEIVSGW